MAISSDSHFATALAPTLQRGSASRCSSVPRARAETDRWSGVDGVPTLERGNENPHNLVLTAHESNQMDWL